MSFNNTNSMENKFGKENGVNQYSNMTKIYTEATPIYQDGDFNFIDENKKKILSFYLKYKYLCGKYEIDNIRKNQIDTIIKKVKAKIFKRIHEVLKYCLKKNLNRLPKNFINSINIEYNRKYLDKTISEIYLEFSILPSLKEIIENKMIKKDKTEILTLFLNSSLISIIQVYLKSNFFVYDKNKIQKKSGSKDVILFDFVANNICNYFQYNKIGTYNTTTNVNNINIKEDECRDIVIDINNNLDNNNNSNNNVSNF